MHLKETINHAALLIQRRQYAKAYLELREALELQQRMLQASHGGSDDCNKLTEEASPAMSLLGIAPLIPCGGKTAWPDDPLFMFPLVIHASESCVNDTAYACSFCATAAFNMGLACHLYVDQTGVSSQDRKRYFRLAQAFYQQAFHMSKNLVLPVLQMALCNNLVEVAIEQNDWRSARFWASLFVKWTHDQPRKVSGDLWAHFVEASSFYISLLSRANCST